MTSSRVVVAVRAALPSPRPQGWQATQMAFAFASLGLPTTLVGDPALPDGVPDTVNEWVGDLPDCLDAVVPPAPLRPPMAGLRFRRALRTLQGTDALLLCRDPRVAAAQPRGRWGAVVMEWHVRPDPSDRRHRRALRRADLHVTVARGLADDLLAAGVRASRLLLLHNACGLDVDRAARRRASLGAGGPHHVLALGLHRRSGLDDALDAWASAPTLPPLHIAGRDQGGVRVGAWAVRLDALGLTDRVKLMPPAWGVDREAILDGAACWLAAYPDDGDTRTRLSPLQVADALGSGLPLVAPDLPSVRDIAGDAPFHAYRPGDASSLAAAVHEALERPMVGDPARRPRWLDRARALLDVVREGVAA